MSLNYDLTSIPNYQTVCYDGDQLNQKTEQLIWLCAIVSLGTITQRNHIDYFVRLSIYESCFGLFGDEPFTLEDIKKHIGLSTNCGNESYPQFLKKVYNRVKREATE